MLELQKHSKTFSALFLGICLLGCVSHTVRTVDLTPPAQSTLEISESLLLDIGVAVFDPNVPDSFEKLEESNIQTEIRRAESNYMPFFFKNLIQSTGNWGAVRVVPRETHAVDVTVSGQIVHSDGERMILKAKVSDARGIVWFDKVYETLASKYAYDDIVPKEIDPYQATYKRLADDMLSIRERLTDSEIHEIRRTAEMKFALDFSPDAFSNHVVEISPNNYEVRRLPADNDPMLEQIRKIREREYLFIDTLDEYYATFAQAMFLPYHDWRRATYDEAIAFREERNKAKSRTWVGAAAIVSGVAGQSSADRMANYGGAVSIIGGAALVKSGIEKRANAKLHSEVLQELGVSAETEIMPHTIELENQTLSLQGTVDEQYTELRRILKRLYLEELGQPIPVELKPEPGQSVIFTEDDDKNDEYEQSI
jgi:hypothetical protein